MASAGYSVGLCLLLHLELEGEKMALKNLHLWTWKCRNKTCTCALCFVEEWGTLLGELSTWPPPLGRMSCRGFSEERIWGAEPSGLWGARALLALSNKHQPFCATWDGETGHRLQCSRCLNPWLHWQPPNLRAPLQWQNRECPEQIGVSSDGRDWLMFGQLFPMFILSGRYFPPYSKCNKQKYCLKSIIEHIVFYFIY